ncbi:TonB-dependent receptor [uncultured Draconibacterium sp.]|uniref:TonB-dependent receptor n=1 Tax=uncultured Draconibacterium sp. TaxID=1573823 RepID=UPI0025D6DC70|nr:TonB-dependent receptor [uncultured Draconibacterium sp.]
MKKNYELLQLLLIGCKKKMIFMRNTLLILLLSAFHVVASVSYSQSTKLTLNLENTSIKEVMNEIERMSEFYFLYNSELIDVERKVDVNIEDENIEKIMSLLFENDVDVMFKDRHIIISPKSEVQQSTVSGTVIDDSGVPLPGVTVVVKGTTQGTVTDSDGNYALPNVSGNSILVFSFVGMETQEIPVAGSSKINVTMLVDAIGIEEVVAVGYGTMKKVNLTGSVESVDGTKIARQPVAQASQALVGLSPGLTAIQSSGQPGEDNATLRIRGLGSIGASNDPLILIDGVEGDLNMIDPNNIEDMSVLKDAASAAIYGSRASNGVILITTKRANANEMSVSYKNYVGWQKATELPQFAGALDFLKYSGEDQATIDAYAQGMKSDPDLYPDTDWVDLLFSESGFQQYHNLTVNGGTEKVKVLASISYTDQGANIVNYGLTRYNGRFNTDMKFSEKFDVNFDLNFSKSLTKSPHGTLEAITHHAFSMPPNYPAIHSDGSWGSGFGGGNPVAYAHEGGYRNTHSNYFRGILKANLSPIDGLKFTVMYSPEYADTYKKAFEKTYTQILDWTTKSENIINTPNNFKQTNGRAFTHNFNALVSYEKNFNDHRISALAGYEVIQDEYEMFAASRDYYILQKYEVLDAGSQEHDNNEGTATHSALVSQFGQVNYAFKDRYLLDAKIRRDASSRFNSDNRVGIFPSFSAAWRISEEGFLKDSELISNMKVRASWGQLGNQQIGSDFPYVSSVSLGAYNYLLGGNVVTGASQTVLANPEIKWETTETTNIGLDLGLYDQRLSVTFDYYIRKTKDILLNIPIPLVIGLEAPVQNAGNVENKGFDFSLDWQDKMGDFSYGARVIISDVKNKVTNLANVGPIISGDSYTAVGHPIGLIYGYETVGIFQDQASIDAAPTQFGTLQPGNLQFKDQLTVDTNGDGVPDQTDGVINADDRVTLGNPFPRLSYGIDLNAEYKGFDLAISMQGVGRRDAFLGGKLIWPMFNAGKLQEWHIEECWSPENRDAKYPILAPTSFGSNDIRTNSTWVFDASYFRIRNISLGYTFPQTILHKTFIDDLRIYFSSMNPFTFHKLPEGVDPLVPNGSQGSIYPVTTNYIFGIDLKF